MVDRKLGRVRKVLGLGHGDRNLEPGDFRLIDNFGIELFDYCVSGDR